MRHLKCFPVSFADSHVYFSRHRSVSGASERIELSIELSVKVVDDEGKSRMSVDSSPCWHSVSGLHTSQNIPIHRPSQENIGP